MKQELPETSLMWCPELGVFRLILYGSEGLLSSHELAERIEAFGEGNIRKALEEWRERAEGNPNIQVNWEIPA